MSQPRIEMNATILPNGEVLATGGLTNDEDALTASRQTRTCTIRAPIPSLQLEQTRFHGSHHLNALLLPTTTVLLIGGNLYVHLRMFG